MSAPGPLVVRWHGLERAPVEAGALQRATVEVENAGTATWRTRGPKDGLFLSYHWLDERGNPIVWDGRRTPLDRPVAPGETLRQELSLRAPIPPGRYRLAVDIVEEHRFWLAELGNAPFEEEVDVGVRDASAARAFLPGGRGAVARLARARARPSRRGLLRRRQRGRAGARRAPAPRHGARAVRTRRRPPSSLPPPARLPVAPASAGAERRGRRTARLRPRRRRAVDVRRPSRGQTSIAIWSSTRLNTQAPIASETTQATAA